MSDDACDRPIPAEGADRELWRVEMLAHAAELQRRIVRLRALADQLETLRRLRKGQP